MKFNKLGAIVLILFVFMMVVNAVAAEDNTLVGAADEKLMAENESPTVLLDDSGNDGNTELSAANSQEILQFTEIGNFTELKNLIDSNPNGAISLDKDYAYSGSDDIDNITIIHSITINGNGHAISGENKVMSFFIPDTVNNVILNNITFLNGNGNSTVWIKGDHCLVDNCTFKDNNPSSHAPLRINGYSNNVYNSKFINNNALYGGAVFVGGYYNLIRNCTFEDNEVNYYYAGAVYLAGCYNSIYDSSFNNNKKAFYGGAVYMGGYNNLVKNSTFVDNDAYYGGAIFVYHRDNTIDNCSFINNHADVVGGALYMDYTGSIINNSIFDSNSANYYAGAVYFSPSVNNNIINNSKFNDNFLDYDYSYGGAVYVSGDGVTISNSQFDGHNAYCGGAIYWLAENGTVSGSTFNENNATYGGAIHWESVGGTIEGSQFNENYAKYNGGAIYVTKPNLTINKSKFSKNVAKSLAGAIYISTDNVTVNHSEFYENHANDAGAIEVYGMNNIICDSTFEDNVADRDGGAILIAYNYLHPYDKLNSTICGSKFIDNDAARYGGAIRVSSEGNAIDDSEFYYNGAEIGGAVSVNANNNYIDNSKFEHNHASEGGAVNLNSQNLVLNNSYLNFNNATYGGAVYVNYFAYNAVVNNSKFIQNDAFSYGGAIYWSSMDGTVDNSLFYNNWVNANQLNAARGGAIYWNGENALINNSEFTWNLAYNYGGSSDGGAIDIENNNAAIENCVFENNVAGSNGGAVRFYGNNESIYNSTFEGNNASTEGGAIYASGKDILINGSKFTKNHAFFLGGAVALESSATIDDSTFIENSANKGGAVYWDAREGTVNNSYFYKNSAYYAGGAISCDYYNFQGEKLIENSIFEENSACNYGGAITALNAEIVNSTFINNQAHAGEAIRSYSSKISDSTFENNDVLVQKTELIQINYPNDIIGNSTRKTNTSYIAMCVERYTIFPHLGIKDDSLGNLVNVINGTSIADYLKILVFTYFNSTDDVYPHEGDHILFYPEAYRDNPNRWDYVVEIPRPDYYSRAVHEFSDHDFWNSDHPVVKKVLELYETVYANGTKMPDKFIKEVNGSLIEYDFSSMISPTSQSLFLFNMIKHNMSVQKIALNKTVYLGDQTMFKIVVTNNGESNLTDITVTETEYEGLKLVGYEATDDWTGNTTTGIFVYTGTLKPGENASFIAIFDTIRKGNFTNVVVASNKNTTDKKANNTTEVVPIRVNVTKEWYDNDNQDGLRPENVTIYLVADDEKINEIVLSEENNWNFIFNDLPMVKNGQVINYTVSEKPIANYTMNIVDNTVDDFNIIVANNTYIFTVTNTHVPAVTDVPVIKVWDDNGNQDGVRPVSVNVQLLADGVVINSTVLSVDNEWSFTFADLVVYKHNGTEIVYTINETAVPCYVSEIACDSNGCWVVTNSHVPAVTDVSVVKVWDDVDNQDGVRPVSVTVVLLADGEEVARAALDADHDWSATFAGLPVYSAGNVIVYSVDEVGVDNYTVAIVNGSAYAFTVINTHVPIVPIEIENVTNSTPNYGSESNDTEVIGSHEVPENPILIYEIPEITPGQPIKFDSNKTHEDPVISTPVTPEPVINVTNSSDNLTVPEEEPVGEEPVEEPPVQETEEEPTVEKEDDSTEEETPVEETEEEQTYKQSKDLKVNNKQTGNPILVLLLALMSIVVLKIERKRK